MHRWSERHSTAAFLETTPENPYNMFIIDQIESFGDKTTSKIQPISFICSPSIPILNLISGKITNKKIPSRETFHSSLPALVG